jgi:hypothetical protein
MLTVAKMSMKTRIKVGRCAAVLGAMSWFFFIELFIYLAYTRPHKIDVAAGRVYSINNHGSIAYLTRAEHVFLYAFAFVAGALVIIAAISHNVTRAANAERLGK